MSVPATVRIEAGLSDSAFASPQFSESFGGSEWVDITTECRGIEPIACEYGIFSDDPLDLVAGSGSLRFALDNSSRNAAGIVGWYSPLNAIKRGGFDFSIPVRFSVSNGVTTSYKFRGALADILVTPGTLEDRLVRCTALDLMDDYSRLPSPPLDAQFNRRGDELVQFVLGALPSDLQPTNRTIETSFDTHEIALDKAEEEAVSIRETIYDICISEMARAGFVGTTTPGGGLFVFRNRQSDIYNPSILHHFDLDMLAGSVVVPGSRDDVVSKVQVFVHPTRIDTAPVILYDLQTTATLVGPGETNSFLFGPYRDPDNPGDRVGGKDMIPPAAVTDYLMNTLSDGTGTDLTANFSVVASFTGTGVRFTITNFGSTPGYITQLQARGYGIYRYVAVIEREIPNVSRGHNVKQIDMRYQNNVNVGTSVADYISNVFSRSLSRVTSITFLATASSTLLAAMIVGEPGHRISITEPVVGLDATEFFINGVKIMVEEGQVWCTWFLRGADMQRYWILGQAGASELGTTTVLGY